MPTQKSKANPMWGGHFDAGPSQVMEEINASIRFDCKLYAEDIEGSLAHVEMLAKAKIIDAEDATMIQNGLNEIRKEIESEKFTFNPALEDIHMNVEARLHELVGPVAGKLHTARSRNDQVATDFKLYVRKAYDKTDIALAELQRILLKQAEKHIETIMPGYTHLQTAQPVTFAHHLLAYVEMLGRDRSRIADGRKRMNQCPLGAAALAGTSFPINRKATAKALGFDEPTHNSIDSVSDRDFAIDYMAMASACMMHLSRLAEELVIWCSADFSFVTLPDSFTTGSSIMPQKRNPDAAELVRAKTGRIYGDLFTLLTVMKGLPLTYSKDMQEDKEPLFDAVDNISLCISAMQGMMSELKVNEKNMEKAAARGYSTATDLADWLVRVLGIPFRQAHHITGKVVKIAEKNKCELKDVSLKEMQTVEPRISDEVFAVLSVKNSVRSRQSQGGTSPEVVSKAVKEAYKRYHISNK